MKESNPRFFLSTDNSCHDYVIPVARRLEWEAFMDIPEDDERAWDVPEWAVRVDGRLTFTDPQSKE